MNTAPPFDSGSRPVLALDGPALLATAAGLESLLAAVSSPAVVWFSDRPGPAPEDLRVIACAAPELCPDLTVGVPLRGPVSALLGDGVREYALTHQVSVHFSALAKDGFWVVRADRHRASVAPTSDALIQRVLEREVRRAGVASDRVVRWGATAGAIAKLLRSYRAVRLSLARLERESGVLSVEVPSEPSYVDDRLRPAVLATSFRPIGTLDLELAPEADPLRALPRRPGA